MPRSGYACPSNGNYVSARGVDRLRDLSKGSAIEQLVIDTFGTGPYASATVSFAQVDAISAAVGRGDRLIETDTPFAGEVEVLFPESASPAQKPKAASPSP